MDRRSFVTKAAMMVGALSFADHSLLAQTPDDALIASVDPELRPLARQMLPFFKTQGALSAETLSKQRSAAVAFAKKPAADIPYERRQIPGAAGQPPVTIFVVNAGRESTRPAILHTHGGGFVAGSAASSIEMLQALCRNLGCVAVSVEYRLAPETTFRGSIEDNYAGLKWLYQNAGALGVDSSRIAVMGESAGGGHAALLAITARDRGEVPLAFQCLTYPMLDDRTGISRPVSRYAGRLVWTAESNRFGWQSFLGMKPGTSRTPSEAVPARTANLAGLPPAFIGVGSIDLFANEDIDYAQRLNDAGVMTELAVVPGVFHGFDVLPVPSKVAERFTATKLAALRRGLGIKGS